MDLDSLKAINDRHGHLAGDRALVHASRLITQAVRPGDTVSRYGGDEVVAVLWGGDLEAATDTGQRLIEAVGQTPVLLPDGQSLSIWLSAGIAAYPQHGSTSSEIIAAADAAMYAAKQAGGQQSIVATAEPSASPL